MINTVGSIPGAVGKNWNGIATSCHFATCFWLYEDEFSRQLSTAMEYGNSIANPTNIISSMLQYGRILSRPAFGSLNLIPGSIIVFSRDGVTADHSCVALSTNTIGGYNQEGWFSVRGFVDHSFSIHNTSEIVWRGAGHPTEVKRPLNGLVYKLYTIDEGVAKAVLRQNAQH